MKIYLASPLGFSEAGRAFYYGSIIPIIEACGHIVIDPWMLTAPETLRSIVEMGYGEAQRDEYQALNTKIGRTNARAIDDCDAVFAVLDGVDVDSGTAAEIGYAAARGKPILGYRGDFRLCADNCGAVVNLQVEYFIMASGGGIIRKISDLEKMLNRLGQETNKSLTE